MHYQLVEAHSFFKHCALIIFTRWRLLPSFRLSGRTAAVKTTMSRQLEILVLLATIHGVTGVTIPPKITDQSPVDIYYKVGESVKLKCKASGMPAPKYSWKRADAVFSPEGNEDRVVQMRDEGTIIINRPEDKDEGFYQCFAKNNFGVAATIKFNLRQAKLKGYSFSPPTTYVPRLGTSLSLPCPSPDSVPDAEIYWAVSSVPIQWDERLSVDYDDSLHFTYVDQEDAGKCFHCVATNNFMRMSVKGPLHCINPTGQLTMAPMRLVWPDSQYDSLGMIGESVSLKCIFAGYPTPTVYWTKKGSDRLSARVKTGNSGGQELVITNLQFEDKGTYVCSASKIQADRQLEMSIVLNVESRPEWVAKPQDVTLSVGGSAEFQCEGMGVPAVKVDWFINGETLEEALKKDKRLDKERFQSFKNKLVFQDVRLTDTMVVQCNVTNNNGFLWAEAFLNVLEEKPSILEVPENTKVAEGQNFKLTCKITGKPDPIITWFKDDIQVTGGRYMILESGSLVATTAVLSDAGNYRCHALNIHGEVEASATVIVRRKTVIEMAPKDLEVQNGVSAKFSCSGTTDPEEIAFLTTTWLKDGTAVELGTRMFENYQDSSLTISGTEERDTGTYECVVSNGLDNDTRSARLVITDRPLKCSRVDVVNNCARDNQAEISWMPGAFNNAPIQYYTVEYETTTYPNHWIFAVQANYTQVKTFIPLAPGLTYSFRVTSYNKIGPSPPSDPSTTFCQTRPSAPSQNPRNVRTIGDIPNMLHIEWTPVPPEHQGGPGFKYSLNVLRLGDAQSTVVSTLITDWRVFSYIMTGTGGAYIPYQIGLGSTNDVGNSTDSSQAIIGHTGEGMPVVSPYNLQVVESGSEYVTLQWEFDSSQIGKTSTKINGEFRGFKIQIWQKNKRVQTITNIDLPPEDFKSTSDTFSARLHHMKPNTALEARVAVLNNFYVSAPSEVVGFDSLSGGEYWILLALEVVGFDSLSGGEYWILLALEVVGFDSLSGGEYWILLALEVVGFDSLSGGEYWILLALEVVGFDSLSGGEYWILLALEVVGFDSLSGGEYWILLALEVVGFDSLSGGEYWILLALEVVGFDSLSGGEYWILLALEVVGFDSLSGGEYWILLALEVVGFDSLSGGEYWILLALEVVGFDSLSGGGEYWILLALEVVGFDSLSGVPGPVSYLEELNVGDQHINLQWRAPLDGNKDIIGYDIGFQEVHGLRLGKLQDRIPQIDDPFAATAVLGGLKPSTKYRIFVWARTDAGRSEPFFIERKTAKPGVPMIPRFKISDVGRHFINVTWWKDAYQDSGNVVLVEYMKKDGPEWISTNPDASKNWATLTLLEPGITYSVRIVVTNGASIRRLSETQDVKTRGNAKAYDVVENLGWFLAMLFAILLQILLTILFILCYRRGFRFQTMENQVETYTDKGQTYSDQSVIPRTSSAFQDQQQGFSNDYYKGTDGHDYSDHGGYGGHENSDDGRDGYEDHQYHYSDDDYGFKHREDDHYRGDYEDKHNEDYSDSNYPPYNEDTHQRRYPSEHSYEDYDMDPAEHGRRYPQHDMSYNSPSDSARGETREAGYRTESYRTDRPRDMKREEPRYYEDRAGSAREEHEAKGRSAGRYRDQANRDLVDELRERQSTGNRGTGYDSDQPSQEGRRSEDALKDYSGTLI
ncbi:hypothetical protein RRG08_023673 [Elysia crispata]|uniref:Uncharacterized protein n=1 Tax=Elysia crispata TaxID=231223 RepID=A0AAE1CLN9_9GAST|nr:hypothetical protein RRG08_023673 [Elysia crispata]